MSSTRLKKRLAVKAESALSGKNYPPCDCPSEWPAVIPGVYNLEIKCNCQDLPAPERMGDSLTREQALALRQQVAELPSETNVLFDLANDSDFRVLATTVAVVSGWLSCSFFQWNLTTFPYRTAQRKSYKPCWLVCNRVRYEATVADWMRALRVEETTRPLIQVLKAMDKGDKEYQPHVLLGIILDGLQSLFMITLHMSQVTSIPGVSGLLECLQTCIIKALTPGVLLSPSHRQTVSMVMKVVTADMYYAVADWGREQRAWWYFADLD